MATQALIPGLPPSYQSYLDKMTPAIQQQDLARLADIDRKGARRHNRLRKDMLRDFGEDIGPYKSLYDNLWAYERKNRDQRSDDRALLGVDANASKRDVTNAYRRKARKLHPDVGGDAEAFKQLHESYRKVLAATPK